MKNMFYKLAKSYVEKRDAQKKETEEQIDLARIGAKMVFDKKISEFRKSYVEQLAHRFKENTKPQFEIGEIVTTNWYGPGNSWDGSMFMMQSHTPFRGPIDVEIISVHLDYCEVQEIIDELNRRGEFDNKYTDQSHLSFIVDDYRKKYKKHDISWAYSIKIPNNNTVYWKYTIRENNFLKRKSDVAKWSKKCYANEVKASKLYESKKILDDKIKHQLEKITNSTVIVSGQ